MDSVKDNIRGEDTGKVDSVDGHHFEDSFSIEGAVARSTVRAGSIFAAISTLLFSGLYMMQGPSKFVLPNLLASATYVIIGAVRIKNVTLSVYSAITTALLLFGYQLVLVGHIDNGISVWLLAPNVAAIILGMRKLAFYCVAITIVEIVGVLIGARIGWFTNDRVVLPEPDIVMGTTMFAVLGICSLFALITNRARRRLTGELTARNKDLAEALEETHHARNVAIEASKAKERFFANLTHEIRTPLNGIAGTVELLDHTVLSTEQAPLTKALRMSTVNLTDLVNTMLDHAKITAGHTKVEHAPLNLPQLAQDLMGMFGARAAEKALSLTVMVTEGSPPWIETDGLKIKQIIGNLVGNAIKFTFQGTVNVRLSCQYRENESERMRLVVEVRDTGIGIAPERLASVFEPFIQGDASITRAHGGTGLGLSIARQLAELLGGTLYGRSSPDEGSTFVLDVPVILTDAPRHVSDRVVIKNTNLPGLRVLLVEDNPVNQLVAKAMLESIMAEVIIANDGLEAVEMASDGSYHVIFMDLQMPGMDGITATQKIRTQEKITKKQPIPIIAMTGNSSDDYGEACRRSGMDGFLTKPITLDQLTHQLASLDSRFVSLETIKE